MKKFGVICTIPFLALVFSFGAASVDTEANIAEAAHPPTPQIAQREMKRSKDYQSSPIYERSHQLIYGNDPVIGAGDRPRIAVVINGDENLVVEDRIKNQIYSQLRKKFPREYFALMKGTDINTKLLQYAEDIYYDEREIATTEDTTFDVTSSKRGLDISLGQTNTDSHSYTDGAENGIYAGSSDPSFGGGDYSGFNSNLFNSQTVGDARSRNIGGGVHLGTRRDSIHRVRITKPSTVDVDGMPVGVQPRGLADMRREDYVRAGRDCGYDYVFVVSFSNGQSQIYKQDYVLFNTNSVHKNVWVRVRFVDVSTGDYLYRNNIVAGGKTHNGNVNGRVMERAVQKAMEEAMNDLDFVS